MWRGVPRGEVSKRNLSRGQTQKIIKPGGRVGTRTKKCMSRHCKRKIWFSTTKKLSRHNLEKTKKKKKKDKTGIPPL